ncbi:MAG: hypothetical protein IKO67_08135 [Bacteroidaceae bacterium]|nr:hypothetical protein [Bacteroidaceae bacterium]
MTEAPSFSVSDDKQVYFSPGNLQAVCTSADGDASTQETWTWQFAANQWDYIGNVAANNSIDGNGSTSAAGIVDLFGWSSSNTYFGIGGSSAIDYYHDNFADWGRNVIGSYAADTWRTLTTAEWTYLFNTRTVNGGTGEGYSYTLGKSINGKLGIVFYPDNYTGSEYAGSNWSTFEAAGCVFLPTAGWRKPDGTFDYIGELGRYWSSTDYGSYSPQTYLIGIWSSSVNLNDYSTRNNGHSVRLIHDAN